MAETKRASGYQNPNNKNYSAKKEVVRKCLRKGSKVCYMDEQKVTVLRRIPDEKDTRNSSMEKETQQKVESFRSGESLFKTFTFEQTDDLEDPETVKCMEFWKSVVRKNLEPIKCTLIECDKQCPQRPKKKVTNISNKTVKTDDIQKKVEKEESPANAAEIWSNALKEIRRKKLHNLKMYAKERCEYCSDPFSKYNKNELGVEDEQEQIDQIASLNEWKPHSQQHSDGSMPITRRLLGRFKKVSSSQTKETRMQEEKTSNSELKNSESKKLSLLPKQETLHETPNRMSSTLTNPELKQISTETTEAQVPSIKCSCDSNSCICPHRTAKRNSRTSFVESARINMIIEDSSKANFSPDETSCLCSKLDQYPWWNITCSTELCTEKAPKVDFKESSSDFNLNEILKKEEFSCVCSKGIEVVCQSEQCKNKESQGSLVEGYHHKSDHEIDNCDCSMNNIEKSCHNTTCPIRYPKQKSLKCTCSKSLPWVSSKCQSWSCPHRRMELLKIKKNQSHEKISHRKYAPLKEITSKCVCQKSQPWQLVNCLCEECLNKDELKSESKNTPSRILPTVLIGKENYSSAQPNKDIIGHQVENEENINQNNIPTSIKDDCICCTSPVWKQVLCSTPTCKDDRQKNLKSSSDSQKKIILNQTEETDFQRDCICDDKNIEPLCRAHKCSARGVEVNYTPPCLCPKNEKEAHFKCTSDKCKMKKIDKSCICDSPLKTPCNEVSCNSKYVKKTSRKLKTFSKYLRYDSQCICKVRGVATTKEVKCDAKDCPLKRKVLEQQKKKKPLVSILTNGYKLSSSNSQNRKCLCENEKFSAAVNCTSTTCHRKKSIRYNLSGQGNEDDVRDDENPQSETCICNYLDDSDLEVICQQIQCEKKVSSKEEILLNEKCICTNSECDELACQNISTINIQESSKNLNKNQRSYCYICGNNNCVKKEKKKLHSKPCFEN